MVMLISPSILRLTWAAVEEIQSGDLLLLTDTALVRMILRQVARKVLLDGDEVCLLYEYVSNRMPLIRDMAESRQIQSNYLENVKEAVGSIAALR